MFVNNIPEILEVGKTYTQNEIVAFINTNPDTAIILDQPMQFSFSGATEYKVEKAFKGYIHSVINSKLNVPGAESSIYVAKKK